MSRDLEEVEELRKSMSWNISAPGCLPQSEWGNRVRVRSGQGGPPHGSRLREMAIDEQFWAGE